MAGGIMLPKRQEPEDIFGDLEKTAEKEGSALEAMMEEKPRGGIMRYVIMGLVGLVIMAVLGVGGFFFYSRFIATAPPTAGIAPPAPPVEAPTTPTLAPSQPPAVIPTTTSESEPAVPPSPPAGIPPPTPVQQPKDTDGDGLTDDQEATLGTNAKASDTDGDGLTDGEEVNVYKTDPLRADTDGDGLTDGDEVKVWKTDPTKADTDGDGFSDGQEVQNGYNPNGPGKLPVPPNGR